MPRPFERLPWREVPDSPRLPHPYFATPGRDVEVSSRAFGEVSIHVREAGSGPPLLLIHGLMTTSYSWRYVLEDLARDFRVIAPDLVGCGRSSKPASASFHPDHVADSIVELQEALGVVGCDVVGNSMGGYLCMRAALRRPGAFRRLVNVHSPAVPLLRLHALRAASALPGARRLLRALVRRDVERWVYRNVHYFDETLKSREEAREYAEGLRSDEGVDCFAGYLFETMDVTELARFAAELSARKQRGEPFPVPLLLLYARADPMVPPSVGERLSALLPGVPLRWMDSTSHFAHVDTPELVTREVRAFLR